MFADTPWGPILGTTIGTDGPYRVDILLIDRKIISGYGLVFVPLARVREEPMTSGWTKLIVTSGEHAGNFGFIKINEDAAEQSSIKGILETH